MNIQPHSFKPTQSHHTTTNMTNDTIYYNNVKFTGRIDESGDVITVLLYFALLIMMALNALPNLNLD